jgi:hypothetical protein
LRGWRRCRKSPNLANQYKAKGYDIDSGSHELRPTELCGQLQHLASYLQGKGLITIMLSLSVWGDAAHANHFVNKRGRSSKRRGRADLAALHQLIEKLAET